MDALPPGLLTDGESRGDAGNLIIVERLPTVLLDIVRDDDACYTDYTAVIITLNYCVTKMNSYILLRPACSNAYKHARMRWVND